MTGWAVVELMGHVRLVGEVAEVEMFGTKMGRIDVLERSGDRVTQYFAGGAVYRITPTDEAAAREMMKPYEPYRLSLPDPGEEDVPANFVPRPRPDEVRFNAWTDDEGDVIESPLAVGARYQINAFLFGDLIEPVNGGEFEVGTGGIFAFPCQLDLAPNREYHFVAVPLPSPAPEDGAPDHD